MAKTTAEKLRIVPGARLLAVQAPGDFKRELGTLPSRVKIEAVNSLPSASLSPFDQLHWFVQDQAVLEKSVDNLLRQLSGDLLVWIYYPKGSSGLQTDLTRDKGWDSLMSREEDFTWLSLISFNDTWSAFGIRARTEKDKRKEARPRAIREIFSWVDPVSKKVSLPPDVAAAFAKSKKAVSFFETLSFTNKKEYVEWIVTAKQEQTRSRRIIDTVQRLGQGWKNPANR